VARNVHAIMHCTKSILNLSGKMHAQGCVCIHAEACIADSTQKQSMLVTSSSVEADGHHNARGNT
jgi:hypothetical protein